MPLRRGALRVYFLSWIAIKLTHGFISPWKEVRSLLTSIRNVHMAYEQNIISSLSMVFHKAIRAYCFIPNPLVSSAPESRLYFHAYSSFVTSHRGALTFTGHWPQTYCMVSGAYVPKVVLELERTAYALNIWTTSPPGRSSRLRWCTQ